MESWTVGYTPIFYCVEDCAPNPRLFRVNHMQFFGIKYAYIVQPSLPSISELILQNWNSVSIKQ